MSMTNGTNSSLTTIMTQRSEKILNQFKQTVVLGINNSELRSILLDVAKWRDMFRPTLASLSCEAVGGQPEKTEKAGLMFTLFAAGIGIHDDIIDKSEINHFKKTILGKYGLEKALLVGDLLIGKAWMMIGDIIPNAKIMTINKIIEIYGNLCIEMCEAEFMETSCKQKIGNDLKYHEDILWKAMAEFEACSRIGAILGEGTEKEIHALGEFGRRLGFLGRLIDEVQDSRNWEGNLPHRIKYESLPLPIIFAAKSSKEKFCRINSIIMKSRITGSLSKELLELSIDSGAFKYILELAKKNNEEANRNLRILDTSNAHNILSMIIESSYKTLANFCIASDQS